MSKLSRVRVAGLSFIQRMPSPCHVHDLQCHADDGVVSCRVQEKLELGDSVKVEWVRGHSGDKGNTIADAFVTLGVEQHKRRKQTVGHKERS